MKKYIYSLAAIILSVISTVGCSKIEDKSQSADLDGNNVLEATFEEGNKTRTSLSEPNNGVYKALWSADDAIGVFIDGAEDKSMYTLISGKGTPTASFKGYGKGDSYVALYPADMAVRLAGNVMELELPAEQKYVKNSFGPDSYPMLAVSSTNSLVFKNTCAILVVSMTGNHTLRSIEFTANDKNVYVSGKSELDITDAASPTVVMKSGASNSVILNCDGVILNSDNATEFYIVLPAQTYRGGFTLTVTTSTGVMVKSTEKDIVLERSQIRRLETFKCKLDEGVEPSTSLEGSGTESSPFLIQKLEDLLLMQAAVNSIDGVIKPSSGSSAVTANTAHYRLTTDLSLASVCGKGKENWIPIGNYSSNEEYKFKGVFDGDGYTVSDLYIDSELIYQGFFGVYEGVIKNLTVKGFVSGSHACGLVCGGEVTNILSDFGLIENCISIGTVQGFAQCGYEYFPVIGGLVGKGGNLYNCTNYATVSSSKAVGGITGSSSGNIWSCSNYGTITGEGSYTGGIIGYQNMGMMYNCYNDGNVTGCDYTGGISGYSRQGSLLYNCYNVADVSGTDMVGGVIGECDTYNGQPLRTKVKNCINTGSVESTSSSTKVGGVCGYNLSEIANCYWLYDGSNGISTGVGETTEAAKSVNCFPLTDNQMKGDADASEILYTSESGATCSNILDALNGWAFDNATETMILYGWKSGGDDGYPVFTGKAAEKPSGGITPIFELLEDEFSVPYSGGEITVELKATMSYYISSIPDWIEEITPAGTNGSDVAKKHIFKVQANPDNAIREGVIVFCNESQQCIPVSVKQAGKTVFSISKTSFEVGSESNTIEFTVTSSIGYEVKPDAAWIREISSSGGNGVYTHTFEVSANSSTTAREGVIVVCNDEQTCIPVTVKQAGAEPEGDEDMSWTTRTFWHKSLIMRFTADWCGYCPMMATAIDEARTQMPGKLEALSLHASGGLKSDVSASLSSHYKVDGYPTGIVDGRVEVPNYTNTSYTASQMVMYANETVEMYGTVTGASWSSSISGTKASLDLKVYLKSAGSYKVTALLVEDNIIAYQNGVSGLYEHKDVVRAAFTNVLGESATISADNKVLNFKYTISIPSGCKKDNLRVVVYVQKANSNGQYYVDNSASEQLGKNMPLMVVSDGIGGGMEGIEPGDDIPYNN